MLNTVGESVKYSRRLC